MKSIQEVSEELEDSHRKYIESNYHLHHPRLLRERRELMHDGEIATEPWVEASPTYETGEQFVDLDIPSSLAELLNDLKADEGPEIYDPPYLHQAQGLEAFFDRDKDLVVSTGTGSGKTEIFLYSILGQLAQEAERGNSTEQRGIRTLVLYPMNALVADQLARMRLLFGNNLASSKLQDRFNRTVQFGMYTSRTPYHGHYDVDRNTRQLAPIIETYLDLQDEDKALYKELEDKGRIPAKDLEGFRNKHAKGKHTHYRTQPGDSELFTRQEMYDPDNEHGGTPDLLITNYSMLEYMLLRPIEQGLFENTREWLSEDEENELLIVLDEAHLYRGAQGAEVSLLLNRLLQKLGIPRSRARFILTSATMGEDTETVAPKFAAQLTSCDQSKFELIQGKLEKFGEGSPGDEHAANAFANLNYTVQGNEAAIRNLASVRGWDSPDAADDEVEQYLSTQLEEDSIFQLAHENLRKGAQPLRKLATTLFDVPDPELAEEATGNLLHLSTTARRGGGNSLLPTRLHMMLKGLPSQYACVDPECPHRRAKDPDHPLLGRIYTSPRTSCDCGSRVFELMSHRTCGAAYLKAFRQKNDRSNHTFLWSETDSREELEEIHVLVEEPRTDPDPEHPQGAPLAAQTKTRYLNCSTGHLIKSVPDDADNPHIKVWVPGEEQKPPEEDLAWSWTRCPACGIKERRTPQTKETKVMDLVTKGEDPFANIVRSMFDFQPEDPEKAGKYPNAGKKVLCFSDGRQKAARLARDLQRSVELDSFREVMANIIDEYPGLSMDQFFAAFTIYCEEKNIAFFDDEDRYVTQNNVVYPGSRSHFEDLQNKIEEIEESLLLEDREEIIYDEAAREALSEDRPRQYDAMLLRALGHSYFSLSATLVGYLRPVNEVIDAIKEANSEIDPDLVEAITIEALRDACEERAFDPAISAYQRRQSQDYGYLTADDVGMTVDEIIPEHLKDELSHEISENEWTNLARSLVRSNMSTNLFKSVGNMRYVINPEATTIELALEEGWYRCEGCRRFSVVGLDGNCPQEGCNGTLTELDQDDLHLEAKTSFVRDPPRQVVNEEAEPFTLRSEEHSAQLNAKDFSDAFSKAEEYELLFQDILVGENESEQPIDVLSCTTTMEVGIDIGSLTGVAMRTVPPRPENYEQRAGRAGRRGAGLSTIITFADNSPHESFYFNNPEKMIGAESSNPIVYTGNKKIAERHINASLIARFFEPVDQDGDANVFESLGTGAEFFHGSGHFTYEKFKDWVTTEVLQDGSDAASEIALLLPDELGKDEAPEWPVTFVQDTVENLLYELEELQQKVDWSAEDRADENLLNTLLDGALLPTFSFPIDVCDFIVPGMDQSGLPKTEYEMSYDLKQALSAFIPGRQIVVDKKTFTSYGLYFKFADDPVDRARGQNWDSLDWVNYCPTCNAVFEEQETALSDETTCQVCNSQLENIHMFEPPAFAPEVDGDDAVRGERWEEERVYPTTPKYPLTTKSQEAGEDGGMAKPVEGGPSTAEKLADQQLMVVNFGQDQDGFEVCTKCGAVGREGGLSARHNRPYPRDKRYLSDYDWPDQCEGSIIRTTFGHDFPSDLTVLRIPVSSPIKWETNTEWFETAAQSLSEALVIGASRTLDIDQGELEGGFRTRAATGEDAVDIRGYIEIFLFDTTAGGAGFASKTWEAFDDVVTEARKILSGGECNCDSACQECLMNYQNRRHHDILDRHLGEELLEVVETNRPPTLKTGQVTDLMGQLERTMKLQHPDISFEKFSTDSDAWTIALDGSELRVSIRSCLQEEDLAIAGGIDHHISDFNLKRRLPRIAGELSNHLQ